MVDPVRYGEGRNQGAASYFYEGERALLGEAANGLGGNAAELAGGFVEVPK
jgi:hypothetical protein